MNEVKPIPEGYHTVTPTLVVNDGARAIDFYKQAFGAEVMFRMDRPDGKLMHASIKIGDSVVMMGEECKSHAGHEESCGKAPTSVKDTTVGLYLYVENVDKFFDRAVKAGGKVVMPVTDMFWGDRMGQLKDPFGHLWSVATQKELVSEGEIGRRAQEFMQKAA